MAESTTEEKKEIGKKCASTGVTLRNARRYYRNGKYFRNKSTFKTWEAEEKERLAKEAQEAQDKAQADAATAAAAQAEPAPPEEAK